MEATHNCKCKQPLEFHASTCDACCEGLCQGHLLTDQHHYQENCKMNKREKPVAFQYKCDRPRCRKTELVACVCCDCKQNFCIPHRHPWDHGCSAFYPITSDINFDVVTTNEVAHSNSSVDIEAINVVEHVQTVSTLSLQASSQLDGIIIEKEVIDKKDKKVESEKIYPLTLNHQFGHCIVIFAFLLCVGLVGFMFYQIGAH